MSCTADSTICLMDWTAVHVLGLPRMSSNSLSATFLGSLSDQSLSTTRCCRSQPLCPSYLMWRRTKTSWRRTGRGKEEGEESETREGENRERPCWEVMFDENSGSPADRQREKGRLNSAKIETRMGWVKDKRCGRSVWKTEEEEKEETDETGGRPIGQE